MSKQFHFKQLSLTFKLHTNAKQFYLTYKKTLSGAHIFRQSGPGIDDNGGLLNIPQISSISEASASDCLMS